MNKLTKNGIGFIGMLTLTLLVLKVTGYIDCSWFWVAAGGIIEIFS